MVRSKHIYAIVFLFSLCSLAPASGVEQPGMVHLEWNVLLRSWLVIGPFPKAEDGDRGLATDYLGGEKTVTPKEGATVSYGGSNYAWQECESGGPDFQRVLKEKGSTDHSVAYAWTSFWTDTEQFGMVSIGSDDGFCAWLNGEQLMKWVGPGGLYLDQYKARVRFRPGLNTLLLKVENDVETWRAMARLLPNTPDAPLLTLLWDGKKKFFAVGEEVQDVTVEFLTDSGSVSGVHRVSGGRRRGALDIAYPLYAAKPEPTPFADVST